MNTEALDQDVAQVVALLRNQDSHAIRRFLAQCPPAAMKEMAIDIVRPYTHPITLLIALNPLVEDYSRGIDPELGITLSQAIYLYAQELFARNPLAACLSDAGRAAI